MNDEQYEYRIVDTMDSARGPYSCAKDAETERRAADRLFRKRAPHRVQRARIVWEDFQSEEHA